MNPRIASTYSEQPTTQESNSLHDYWLYLKSFAKHGLKIASLAPSSHWVAQCMLRGIDFDNCEVVIELGAGTGAVTASLVKASQGRCRTIIVERDLEFFKRLKERFPAAEIVAGDALKLPQILKKRGIDKIDHVLSTLPINWLPDEQRIDLLSNICQHLDAEGSFRQLTHLPWAREAIFQQYFASVTCPIVLRNLPPAGCYVCRSPLIKTAYANSS
jgi:phospholipid N-methyltransferase